MNFFKVTYVISIIGLSAIALLLTIFLFATGHEITINDYQQVKYILLIFSFVLCILLMTLNLYLKESKYIIFVTLMSLFIVIVEMCYLIRLITKSIGFSNSIYLIAFIMFVLLNTLFATFHVYKKNFK